MSSIPLSLNELSKILETDNHETSKVLEELIQEYREKNTSLEIHRNNDKYQLKVKDLFHDRVSHLAVSADLTKAVLRTLGLIAVKEPILQSEVVKVIGNKAYDYVGELKEQGFITAKKQGKNQVIVSKE